MKNRQKVSFKNLNMKSEFDYEIINNIVIYTDLFTF